MRSLFFLLAFTPFLVTACATTGASLTDISLNMSKAEVTEVLGAPESVVLSFIDGNSNAIEVYEYRLYQYRGAIEGLSPYYNLYSLIFVNGLLSKFQQTSANARLTEEMALQILRGNQNQSDIVIQQINH